MADYKVILVPTNAEEQTQALILEQVDVGWNQLGWLTFTNEQREPIASFTPGSVRFFIRVDGNEIEELPELVDEIPSNVVSIN